MIQAQIHWTINDLYNEIMWFNYECWSLGAVVTRLFERMQVSWPHDALWLFTQPSKKKYFGQRRATGGGGGIGCHWRMTAGGRRVKRAGESQKRAHTGGWTYALIQASFGRAPCNCWGEKRAARKTRVSSLFVSENFIQHQEKIRREEKVALAAGRFITMNVTRRTGGTSSKQRKQRGASFETTVEEK
jgi:hypothetical protein